MIEVSGLARRHGPRVLFDGLHHRFRRGGLTAICGPSGSGKSSLLRLLNQLERHDAGVLRFDGMELPAGLPLAHWQPLAQALRQRVGMVFQGSNLFPHLTVLDNVALAPRVLRRLTPAAATSQAKDLLAQVGLAAAALRYPARLSGGEAQRVAIARALATRPEVLLLDEPTSALDPMATAAVVQVLRDLRDRGMTLVLVTHDRALAHDLADDLLELGKG
jgi:ABC-type polar amino acid transport system ATPase subunit